MGVTLQRLAQAAQMTDFSKMENTNSQFEQAMKELAPEESGDYKVRSLCSRHTIATRKSQYLTFRQDQSLKLCRESEDSRECKQNNE
jgi:flagellar hook assembly protein FlgD